jgi:CubicO group peptidase (beta-lactamase class C family)
MWECGRLSRQALASGILAVASGSAVLTPGLAQVPVRRASIVKQVDTYLKPYLDAAAFSGAVLIARGGKILLSKGYGLANYELNVPNTRQTKLHLASVSKTFTAAAILLLQERGLLGVQDPIARFIPAYPRGNEITLHHLLTHTSGIPDINDVSGYDSLSRFAQTPASLIAVFRDRPLLFEPGARYSYSNSNYNLLAYVIEKVSGQTYGDFLHENIFGPAGMTSTSHDGDPATLVTNRATGYVPSGLFGLANAPFLDWSAKTGNGSIYSTVEDLYRWDRVLYTDALLKRTSIDLMFTPHVEGVGYGWLVRRQFGRRVIRMSGRSPGFSTEIQRYLDDDVCIIVLSNNYAATATTIAGDLAAMVFGEKYHVLAVVQPVKVPTSLLDVYAGRYQGGPDFLIPGVRLSLEIRGGRLTMVWSSGAVVPLVPQSDSTFLDRTFWGIVRFVRGRGGDVGELHYQIGGREYVARRLG